MNRYQLVKISLLAAIILAAVSMQSCPILAQEMETTNNDSLFSKQKRLFEKLKIFEAWKLTKGNPDILIGVIDNGFDFFHPDLKDQLVPGFYASGGYHNETIFIGYANSRHVDSSYSGG